MFSTLKKWWRGLGQSTPPVRIPAAGALPGSDDDPSPIAVPARFPNSAAQERFAAAVLNTHRADRKQGGSTTIKREAAFHEAGHAIVAWRSTYHSLGPGAISLAAYGAGEALISLSTSKLKKGGKVPSVAARRDPDVAKDFAVVLAAGLVAEQVAQSLGENVSPNTSCAAPDHALMKDSLEDAGLQMDIEIYESAARQMLQREWPLLLSLANLLFDRGSVENTDVLEFIRDFQVGREMKRPPKVSFEIDSEVNGDFVYRIFDVDSVEIGNIAVSTIVGDERLYLTVFHIKQPFRGKGYGLAALEFVAQQHGNVIVPVYDRSGGFWDYLRNRGGLAFTVDSDIEQHEFYALVAASAEHQRPN